MSFSAFKLSTDNGGSEDFIGGAGNLDDIFAEFITDPIKQAPKNEIKDTNTSPSNPAEIASLTIFAKVVLAYKLINSENESQGNVGIAFIANKEHRLILYRTKQDILSTFTLTLPNAVIYAKTDYLQYSDDAKQFWSIRFTQPSDREEFLTAVKSHCSIEEETLKQIEPLVESNTPAADEKPSLLSRMAKMGHHLPLANPYVKEASSDSEDVDSEPIGPLRHQMVATKWKPDVPSRPPSHQYPAANASPILSTSTLISYTNGGRSSDSDMMSLFTENRFQNTEVRMCLSKLETKIERVLDKMDTIKDGQGSAAKPKSDLEEEIIQLEEKVLMLKKENRQLRLGRDQESQADRAMVNQMKVEIEKSVLLQTQIDSQTEELAELRKLNAEQETNIESLGSFRQQLEEQYNIQKVEHENQIKELLEKETNLNNKIYELKTTAQDLEAHKITSKCEQTRLQETVKQLEQKLHDVQLVTAPSTVDMEHVVKDIMNNLYQNMQETIGNRTEWSSEDVLKLIRIAIKRETISVLSKTNP